MNKPGHYLSFTIEGEPASKANSRRLVSFRGRPALIKSKKAMDYTKAFRESCPRLDPLITGYVHVDIFVWYSSWRPDLDESIILDAMQGLVYVNDRQVVSKYVRRGIDRERPRTRIYVQTLEGLPSENVLGHLGPPEASG